MTPEERLDQLEPLLADSLQKIDRLMEGQSKLLDLATKTEHRSNIMERQVDKLADVTVSLAQQVSKLTDVTTDLAFQVGKLTDVTTKIGQQVGIIAKGLGNLTLKVNQISENQNSLADKQDRLSENQEKMEQEFKAGFSETNQRFDSLQKFLEDRLK